MASDTVICLTFLLAAIDSHLCMLTLAAGELNLCLVAVDLSGGGVKEEVNEQRAGSALCAESEG